MVVDVVVVVIVVGHIQQQQQQWQLPCSGKKREKKHHYITSRFFISLAVSLLPRYVYDDCDCRLSHNKTTVSSFHVRSIISINSFQTQSLCLLFLSPPSSDSSVSDVFARRHRLGW